MSIVENVRNAIVFTTVRFVFISIPLFGLVKVVLLPAASYLLLPNSLADGPNSFSFLSASVPYFRYSAASGCNVPRRKARSFINTKKTETRINT